MHGPPRLGAAAFLGCVAPEAGEQQVHGVVEDRLRADGRQRRAGGTALRG